MYMSLLGQPTDANLNTYPHVLLTGPCRILGLTALNSLLQYVN